MALVIRNVHLPSQQGSGDEGLWNVHCQKGRVVRVEHAAQSSRRLAPRVLKLPAFLRPGRELDARGKGILLPSLCHAHIHIDKCFLLDQCRPLRSGSFEEALKITSEAKTRFALNMDDVYARGHRLITESIANGVTSLRAHVEVDNIVGFDCLDIALQLKSDFARVCDIQIAVFAQDPLFDDADAASLGANHDLLSRASRREGVSAVGSAPYVEHTPAQQQHNLSAVLALALARDLHLDLHLDYTLDPATPPLLPILLEQLRQTHWPAHRKVTIGHGTRYTLFAAADWDALDIGDLPVAFVALPQSDMYMMGRTADQARLAPRGTLPVPYMAARGLEVALSVNNVDNPFTPQGSADPLVLCPLGVAIYQDATEETLRTLLVRPGPWIYQKCVSTAAKSSVGLGAREALLRPEPGAQADFVLLHDNASVRSAVLDPCYTRTTIRGGVVVASRRGVEWGAWQARKTAPAYVFGVPVRWDIWIVFWVVVGLWGGWRVGVLLDA
ncbi:Metallo-dependent hydrolase [Artomyces pyxidatus]|uniref:Metallo-dependent hydrolase n=1 Tax=Artomyces pyxidatus TaxID=48021 RepID=A0ACB8SKG7_9AGAM|nr:Metallo-dependent hydrolase [Artomyces pyxidatus]